MSKRHFFSLSAILLLAYLVGLILFIPPKRIEMWVQSFTHDAIKWQQLAVDLNGVTLKQIHFNPPLMTPDRAIDQLTLSPKIFSLLVGKLGVEYQLQFERTQLIGEATWNGQQGRITWTNQMAELAKLAALWIGPMSSEIQGSADGSGWLTLTTTAPLSMDGGEWRTQLKDFGAFGAKMTPFTLTGVVKTKNIMEIKIAGKGDVAVSGTLTLQTLWPNLRASSINGELQIQPIKPNLPGLAGQFLRKGEAIRMILSGTLANLQWRIQ